MVQVSTSETSPIGLSDVANCICSVSACCCIQQPKEQLLMYDASVSRDDIELLADPFR
jgi:hypothetical protein